ncbi:gas vesicle protein GvpG [Nocardia africana]|uniref:Gas vesicle protein G n=1 Tax=Nocardia africana TaxID=134964 RepID=A0A378X4Z8_9NOCA|nr:gas vesicle protein GvpG [Nocardia africana]MCC3317106.1 gas vesicle protein GvpG [Nocardia africana]SUA47834.1 Gas vesicle protein G [Nocardia africana]
MGLISSILLLPAAPVRGVIWLSELIQEQVEQQMHDPVRLRRELENIDRAAAAGEISAEEAAQAQQEILNRMTGPR